MKLINPQENLIPHAQLLLLFTTSAQTHIFPEIRIDAVKFLDIFLEGIPQAVVGGIDSKGHGSRVLDAYLGILNAGTKFGGSEGWLLVELSFLDSAKHLQGQQQLLQLQALL